MVPEWVHVATLGATILLALTAMGSTAASYYLLRKHTDPHVIAYVHHDSNRPSLVTIVIENIGESVAYEVSFDLERSIPDQVRRSSPAGEQQDFAPMTTGPLLEGIPALAPGEKRVINWGQLAGLHDALKGRPVGVTASFESRGRHPLDPSGHTVRSVLEVESFRRTDASRSQELEQTEQLKKLAKAVEKIAKGA